MKHKYWILFQLFIFLLLFLNISCLAERITISLYNNYNLQSVIILPESSPFGVTLDNSVNIIIKPGDTLFLSITGDSLDVVKLNGFHRTCSEFRMTGINENATFKVNPVIPVLEEREYNGDIIVSFDINRLLLVNKVQVEQYLAGVVLSEGGAGGLAEYYKTQAILCRTYLYKHINKHIEEGFNLCDDVHCQVYKTRGSQIEKINNAINETAGLVIVDRNSELITAAFHSNCGGQTTNSKDVWIKSFPYFQSIKDPYCHNGNNSTWTRTISVEEWLNYLKENGYSGNDADFVSFEFKQPVRKTHYIVDDFILPLKKIRNDWTLKSSFFNVNYQDNQIVLKGKGYGHGVGLCQEGAMEMARQGKNFRQIISFYYKDVMIERRKPAPGNVEEMKSSAIYE